MAYQSANKSGRLAHTRANVEEKIAYVDTVPINLFKMEKEFGEKTVEEWLKSKKLPSNPDPVTNSNEDHMKVYDVPIAWFRKATGTKDTQELSADGVATAEEVKAFEELRGGSAAQASGDVVIKAEKKRQRRWSRRRLTRSTKGRRRH